MKLFIQHRVNSAKDLEFVSPEQGVEIDLRSDVANPNQLHLSHDPWVKGDDFDLWLEAFREAKIRGPLFLNTKEDGLESAILCRMKDHGISNFTFLDTSPPTLARLCGQEGIRNFAIRLSAWEPIEGMLRLGDKADWVWVDCFGGIPLDAGRVFKAKEHLKSSFILVSPELHGAPIERISDFAALYEAVDGVCTKVPQRWKTLNSYGVKETPCPVRTRVPEEAQKIKI